MKTYEGKSIEIIDVFGNYAEKPKKGTGTRSVKKLKNCKRNTIYPIEDKLQKWRRYSSQLFHDNRASTHIFVHIEQST